MDDTRREPPQRVSFPPPQASAVTAGYLHLSDNLARYLSFRDYLTRNMRNTFQLRRRYDGLLAQRHCQAGIVVD